MLCQVESLEESHEADEHEVQDAIRCLVDVRRMLNRTAKRHSYKTGQAKGRENSSWSKDSASLFDKEAKL